MRILYDHQTFTWQEYGGISRYFYELIRRIKEKDHADVSVLFSNNEYIDPLNLPNVHSFFPNVTFKGKLRLMDYLNKGKSLRYIGKAEFDIFHPTYYDPYFLKLIGGKPFVVTFLDMIHEKFSYKYKELAQDSKIYENKRNLLETASKVIAISQSTKNDIVEIFGVNPDKIKVIYLASSFNESFSTAKRVVDAPYLLYVGNRSMYKNFTFFLESILSILQDNKLLHLVCAGGGRFNETEMNMLTKLGLKNRVIHKSINDAILANLYKNAEVFVFPSLYEGFGIPVLEAFSCGCPCILSDGGSLSEVGGDAAIYFNPESTDSIVYALRTVLNDNEMRLKLREKGYRRQKLFSWDKTYEQTVTLYKSLQ